MVVSQMLERPKLAASTYGIPHTLGIFLTSMLPLVKYKCDFLQLPNKTTTFARNLSANYYNDS